jgi:hypothetical protein
VLALPRVKSSLWYVRVFAGYALVVVACALTLATLDALRFKPGGEFSTPAEHFLFTFVLWGGALLVLGAGPLGLVLAPFLRRGRPVRLPALVGFVFALALVSFAGLGIAGRYERLLSVPAPIVAAGLAAVLVLPLVFLLVRRSHPTGGPGA